MLSLNPINTASKLVTGGSDKGRNREQVQGCFCLAMRQRIPFFHFIDTPMIPKAVVRLFPSRL